MTIPQTETPGMPTPEQPSGPGGPASDPMRPESPEPTRQPVPSPPDHDPGPPVRVVDPVLDDPTPLDDVDHPGRPDITP